METYEAILTRRSIRRYKDQPVGDDVIHDLLEAAMYAPSASDRRPWQFVIIKNRNQLDTLADLLPFGKMLHRAPLGIAVCGDLHRQRLSFWIQDCSAATQNILLTAHDKGLGAVWIGVYPRKERIADVTRVLSLPNGILPLCVISLGYPAEVRIANNRFDSSRVHYDQWDVK